MASIFSRIAAGEIPSYKIAETEKSFAFLDINPLKAGHTLVVPKKEINKIFDVDDDILQDMILLSKRVARAIEKTIPCKRVGVAVIGLEVPHAHIHLIPLETLHDIDFSRPKLTLEDSVMQETAKLIRLAIEA